MKDYNEEYFYVESIGDNYPMLNYFPGGGDFTEVDKEFIPDITSKRILEFANPIPSKPQFADYHYLARHAPVISERLKNVLENMDLKGVQFLPAIIRDNRGNNHDDGYSIVHVYNEIKCMDLEKSDWEQSIFDDEEGSADDIEELVLNNEILDKIPLEERLVFALWENSTYVLYHQSVVEKILEIVPTGLTVYRLSGYDSSLPFIENYIKKSKGEE